MKRNFFSLTAILFALLLWLPFNTVSAEDGGFYIRPILPNDQLSSAGYYHLKGEPGESRTLQVVINNQNDEEITVSVNAANGFSNPYGSMSYSADDTTDFSRYLNEAYKLKDMIDIQDSVTVEAGEEKLVKFTVTIPSDITEGQLLGAIQFTANEKGSNENNESNEDASFADGRRELIVIVIAVGSKVTAVHISVIDVRFIETDVIYVDADNAMLIGTDHDALSFCCNHTLNDRLTASEAKLPCHDDVAVFKVAHNNIGLKCEIIPVFQRRQHRTAADTDKSHAKYKYQRDRTENINKVMQKRVNIVQKRVLFFRLSLLKLQFVSFIHGKYLLSVVIISQ